MDKKTIVRWILDALLALAMIYCGWSIKAINRLETRSVVHESRLTAMEVSISDIKGSVKGIENTLNEMMIEQRIRNGLEEVKLSDRWTAKMHEVYNETLLSALQVYLPELKHTDMPPVRDIQTRYGAGL